MIVIALWIVLGVGVASLLVGLLAIAFAPKRYEVSDDSWHAPGWAYVLVLIGLLVICVASLMLVGALAASGGAT